MNKITKIKQLIKHFFSSLKNQKLTLITSALSTLFGILAICSEDDYFTKESTNNYLFMTFLCSSAVTLPMNIVTKNLKTWLKYLLQISVTAIFSLIFYFIISNPSDYHTMYYLGILLAVIAVTVYLFIPKEDSQSYFANLIKYFLFCGLLSTVLFAGLSLLIFAFNSLIFEFDNFDDIFSSIPLFCYVFFYINIFTFYLFEKRSEPSGKAFKIIFLYALLPVYAVLLVVLYSYLVKALILFTLPQGQLNWYVSFATVFYIVFWFILREYKDNKIVGYFYRYGALILIPLICVQIPAYIIRVNAYGFTGWRYSSLLYTIFATLTIISTFIKKAKYTDYAILVLGVFILFGSLTPFNLIDSAYNSQYKRMEKILTKYEMLNGENLNTQNASKVENLISDDERDKLYSSFSYISRTSEHKMPNWITERYANFSDVFNLSSPYRDKNIISFDESVSENIYAINIEGYKQLKKGYISKYYGESDEDKKIIITLSDFSQVDMSDAILSITELKDFYYYQVNENTTLCITDLYYEYNTETKSFERFHIYYYELLK